MKYIATIDEQEFAIDVHANGQVFDISIEDFDQPIDCKRISQSQYSLLINGNSYLVNVQKNQTGFEVFFRNHPVKVFLKDEVDLLREKFGMGDIAAEMHGVVQAPIPGMVVQIAVKEGDSVEQDASLLVVEAMKMENEIKAPVAGLIKKIHVEQGQNIEKDAILLEIEPE